jgi:HSP20 family protein
MDFSKLLLHGIENIDSTSDISEIISSFNQGVIYTPSVDIIEDDSIINIYMDIPGVEKNSIDLEINNNRLDIKCNRIKLYETNEHNIAKKNEIFYGKITKRITLPISIINKNSIKTCLKNGVLNIIINKRNEEKNKFKVDIE